MEETMERGEETRDEGLVWCTVCSSGSSPQVEMILPHAAESSKDKRCGSCGLLLLKNLKLHDDVKEMVADAGSTKEKKELSPKPKPAGAELKETAGSMEVAPMMDKMDYQTKAAAMLEAEKKRKATGSSRGRKKKKTKMVVQRVGDYYLEQLKNYSPTPVEKPNVFTHPVMKELQAYMYDRYKADLEFRDNIVAQYELKGYAEALIEVTDEDEEEDEDKEEEEEDDDEEEDDEDEEEEKVEE
ncbi:hypothetical protein ACP70R_046753 [Stipagrostis hirtigluma subsp. patula]